MDLTAQCAKAEKLRQLHSAPELLILINVPDVGSARVVEAAGFPAIATSSGGIAWLLGYPDGERIDRDEMLGMVHRIAASVEVPVSADIEGGYGTAPGIVAATVRLTVETGAVGINLEDRSSLPGKPRQANRLIDLPLAVERVKAAREAAEQTGVPLVINARTDGFLLPGHHGKETLDDAIHRANAYREAGADCLFVPGAAERDTIATLVREIDGPVNVLAKLTTPPVSELETLGVARLSVGALVSLGAMALFRRAGNELRGPGTYTFAADALLHSQMNNLLQGGGARDGR